MIKMETGLIHAQDWRGYSLQIKIVLAKNRIISISESIMDEMFEEHFKKNSFIWKMGCITWRYNKQIRDISKVVSAKLEKNDQIANQQVYIRGV